MHLSALSSEAFKQILSLTSSDDIYNLYLTGSTRMVAKLNHDIEDFEVGTRLLSKRVFWPPITRNMHHLRTFRLDWDEPYLSSSFFELESLSTRPIQHLHLRCNFRLLRPYLDLIDRTNSDRFVLGPSFKQLFPQLRSFSARSNTYGPPFGFSEHSWDRLPPTLEVFSMDIVIPILPPLAAILKSLETLVLEDIGDLIPTSSLPSSLTSLCVAHYRGIQLLERIRCFTENPSTPASSEQPSPLLVPNLSSLELYCDKLSVESLNHLSSPTLHKLHLTLRQPLTVSHFAALPRGLLDLSLIKANEGCIHEGFCLVSVLAALPEGLTRLNLTTVELDPEQPHIYCRLPKSLKYCNLLKTQYASDMYDLLPNLEFFDSEEQYTYSNLPNSIRHIVLNIPNDQFLFQAKGPLRALPNLERLDSFPVLMFEIRKGCQTSFATGVAHYDLPQQHSRPMKALWSSMLASHAEAHPHFPYGIFFPGSRYELKQGSSARKILNELPTEDVVIRLDLVLPRTLVHLELQLRDPPDDKMIWIALDRTDSELRPKRPHILKQSLDGPRELLQEPLPVPSSQVIGEPYFFRLHTLHLGPTCMGWRAQNCVLRLLALPPTLTSLTMTDIRIDRITSTFVDLPTGLTELSVGTVTEVDRGSFAILPRGLRSLTLRSSYGTYDIQDMGSLPTSLVKLILPFSKLAEPTPSFPTSAGLALLPAGLSSVLILHLHDSGYQPLSFWEKIIAERQERRQRGPVSSGV